MPDVFQKFPALVAFHKRMAAVPSIAAYLTSSKRPSTTLPPHAPFLNTPEACKWIDIVSTHTYTVTSPRQTRLLRLKTEQTFKPTQFLSLSPSFSCSCFGEWLSFGSLLTTNHLKKPEEEQRFHQSIKPSFVSTAVSLECWPLEPASCFLAPGSKVAMEERFLSPSCQCSDQQIKSFGLTDFTNNAPILIP